MHEFLFICGCLVVAFFVILLAAIMWHAAFPPTNGLTIHTVPIPVNCPPPHNILC